MSITCEFRKVSDGKGKKKSILQVCEVIKL